MRILEVDLRRLVTYWSRQMRESDLGVLWTVDNLCARKDKWKSRMKKNVNGDQSRLGQVSVYNPLRFLYHLHSHQLQVCTSLSQHLGAARTWISLSGANLSLLKLLCLHAQSRGNGLEFIKGVKEPRSSLTHPKTDTAMGHKYFPLILNWDNFDV